jgi:hypothetical protein
MKKFFKYSHAIFLALIILYGCNKSGSLTQTDETDVIDKLIKVKIMEFQTNQPLYAAKLEYKYCKEDPYGTHCETERIVKQLFSDSNGLITYQSSILHGGVNRTSISKDNYWLKLNFDSYNSSVTEDSLTVRLYPISWLKIHLKNEKNYDTPINIVVHTYVIHDSISPAYSPEQNLYMRANKADTTIICKTYGNIKNAIDAGLDSFTIMREVYSNVQFLNKNDTLEAEIIFK